MGKRAKPKVLRALGLGRADAARVAAAHNTAVALGASPKRARTLAVDAAVLNADVGEAARIMLAATPASPSRVSSNPTSSRPTKSGRTAGNGPKGKAARKAVKRAKRVARSLAAGEPITAADLPFVMAGADAHLQAEYVRQLAGQPEPGPSIVPLGTDSGMKLNRVGLHLAARKLAADKMKADPRLAEGEAYADAAVELADRDSGAIWLS